MFTRLRRHRRLTTSVALMAVITVALAGCAEKTEVASTTGTGVPVGATKQQYIDAFADVAPITINFQAALPQGPGTQLYDKYLDSVEEWSGGKITFDRAYANARVEVPDVDAALVDGRLDMAVPLMFLKPKEFPNWLSFMTMSAVPTNAPLESATKFAAFNEVMQSDPKLAEEFKAHGTKPLLAQTSGGPRIFCSDERKSLADFAGATIAAQGPEHTALVESLGATPVSMPFTEFYEALQRGVVDCIFVGPSSVVSGGFLEVAPHEIADAEANVSWNFGPLVIAERKWDSLPTVAQQLLWDKMVVTAENLLSRAWATNFEVGEALAAAGGSANVFDQDARDALNTQSAALVTNAADRISGGPEMLASVESAIEQWRTTAAEFGYDATVDFIDFTDTFDISTVDDAGFAAEVYKQVYEPLRPAA